MATYNGDNDNNTYTGTSSADVINGNGGNDVLFGYDGNDIINGGTGDDYLYGGLGNDTYLIAKNNGKDTLYEEGGSDTVTFTDMLASDISSVSRVNGGGDLLLKYSGGQLTIPGSFNFLNSPNYRIEQFQFSDGTVWNWADISLKALQGTSGNDNLYGYDNSDDILNGLLGNDNLSGNGGNDTLNGGTGDDYMRGGLGNDTYLLASDISQVSRINNGYDLLVKYDTSQLTVQNYFYSANSRIEQIQFSDGTVWGWAEISLKVLQGTSDDDFFLYGYDNSNDTINGFAGSDTLNGFGGDDTLNGGIGNDTLVGGLGNDTYLIAKNDGADTLVDFGGTDTVKFTTMLASDLSKVSRVNDGNDLLLQYGTSQLTVQSYFYSSDLI
ncbi:calcium-binding protein [Methylovulum psychrotolerans]|uniref:Calcium-binding protein n=1 Tax=Methylovulum psychrotolerans TaxID=1704499 RepID=A0A2S5CKG2_9GAMM|nr:calcium-binding protein [Methylovulum psychrotolerans]POZ51309.1 calcium-binding protein [Methylovulum psychrotolerans]